VTSAARLEALVSEMKAAPRLALDTEFHRERTYWPRVALLQIAWTSLPPGPLRVALVDAQAVDLSPFAEVLASPALVVAHAAEQDLEVLALCCGRLPSNLLDTQVMAGFAGHGGASLSSLLERYLGLDLVKGDRLTDWSRRPLSDSQLRYAAADVEHLLDLTDAIGQELERRGRLAWAVEECAGLLDRGHRVAAAERAWWRLRDARRLRGANRGVAQEVAKWRELQAQSLDQPVRTVLPDLALQAIAHNPPGSAAALGRIRGLDPRYLRGGAAQEILQAVSRGRLLPEEAILLPPDDGLPKALRPAVALAAAWVAQVAGDEEIDAALLATRSDLAAFLRGDEGTRLSSGWRAEMVGGPVRRLAEGAAALAFDRRGGLVVEERSGRPLLLPGGS
jgi:ribonuclease D